MYKIIRDHIIENKFKKELKHYKKKIKVIPAIIEILFNTIANEFNYDF